MFSNLKFSIFKLFLNIIEINKINIILIIIDLKFLFKLISLKAILEIYKKIIIKPLT